MCHPSVINCRLFLRLCSAAHSRSSKQFSVPVISKTCSRDGPGKAAHTNLQREGLVVQQELLAVASFTLLESTGALGTFCALLLEMTAWRAALLQG